MVWMGFLKISTYYWCSFQQTYKQCDSLHLNLNHHQISPISMSLPPNEPLESTFVPLQSNSNPAQWWCSCITSPITSVLNAQQQQLPSTLKKKKKQKCLEPLIMLCVTWYTTDSLASSPTFFSLVTQLQLCCPHWCLLGMFPIAGSLIGCFFSLHCSSLVESYDLLPPFLPCNLFIPCSFPL